MAGLFIALIAQFITGLTLVIDKTFLKEKVAGNVYSYVFWIAVFNFFAIFAAPFDLVIPSWNVILLSLAAGAFFSLALIFYYKALEGGEASQTLAILGGFTPLATILLSEVFLQGKLNAFEGLFFIVLTLGGFLMFLADRKKFKKVILWVILAALCLGFVNVFQKISYDKSSFLTGFAIIKLGMSLTGVSLLLVPRWRQLIFERTRETTNRNKILYLSNRALTGIASVGLSYAIKLSHPALIEATSALKYASIFIITLFLTRWWPKILKENFSARVLAIKIVATILIIFGVAGLSTQIYLQNQPKNQVSNIKFGVSFSQKMSTSFGLDWKENYMAVVNDLHPDGVRIMAYWDLVEPSDDFWDFSDLDWQMKVARTAGVKVVIAVGQKAPRWPECHFPSWINFSEVEHKNMELLEFERKVIERYKNADNLLYWQIENEPYIPFGPCPKPDSKLVRQEVELARQIDTRHKLLLTDGGEWGLWYKQVRIGDVFGTTLYRKVYKNKFGSIYPPLTPEYYQMKRAIVSSLVGRKDEPFIVSELGLEPWWGKQIYELPISQQKELLSNKEIDEFVDFARRTNFDTVYMWGSEWWYFIKKSGDGSYWEHVKSIIQKSKSKSQNYN